MATQTPSRYHLLPTHEDEDRDSSPHDSLLGLPPQSIPNTWSFTLNPIVVLRGLSLLLSLIAFLILCIDGGVEFIAVDIFLVCLMIINVLMLIHYTVSHLVKVTVEVRQQAYDLGRAKKPRASLYLDLVFAAALILSLIIGNSVKNRWYGGAWKAAVILGWFVVVMQLLLAFPGLETKSLTITIKLNDYQGKYTPDTKLPSQASTATMGAADFGAARRRGTPEAEEPRQGAEDMYSAV
ncbi:hypothetical protein BDZ45DRAFT_667436 [Acephala macrosclerotiorum]|nr:hypothetical protein BDZ45DRAFT_667436 [Acephala macrosclerotiorum]